MSSSDEKIVHNVHLERRFSRTANGRGNKLKIIGMTLLSSFCGILFGYDQGVVGNVLVLQRFGAEFPRVFMDAGVKGWFVSTLLLGAWLGSLISGPICDRIGRKQNIMYQVLVFLLGSALQTGAKSEGYLFGGRFVAGLAIGSLTHVAPMYIAEISPARMRGALVALQQLSITIGILLSYWIAYGTSHIGGTRCAPEVPYSGPAGADGNPTFDAYKDVPPGGCTGQSAAAWRVPVGIQLFPAIILGVGMFFMPESPRWLVEVGRDDEAKATLGRLRSMPENSSDVINEFVEIKSEVLSIREIRNAHGAGGGALSRFLRPYVELFSSKSNFHRLYLGCTTMFFQQFIGCNAIIYYAPTIFAQLGMDPNTTSLLATGVYGITNTVFTLPAVFFLDKLGRRNLLMTGAAGCCLSLVVVGSLVAAFSHDWPGHVQQGRVAIAFVYIYDVFFSFSWAPIGWVLPSEIFNLATRSTAVSITTSTTWMSNFIIGLVSPLMLEHIPNGGTYFFFAAFAIVGFFSTYFFLPETRNVTLEEMDELFNAKKSDEDRAITTRVAQEVAAVEDQKRSNGV